MFEAIFGSMNCERVLMFLICREKSYPSEIAAFYGSSLTPIQKQLDKLEMGGVLVSRTTGRTRVYEFNPRYPILLELKSLLLKALNYYPVEIQNALRIYRRRPRRRGKPL